MMFQGLRNLAIIRDRRSPSIVVVRVFPRHPFRFFNKSVVCFEIDERRIFRRIRMIHFDGHPNLFQTRQKSADQNKRRRRDAQQFHADVDDAAFQVHRNLI